MARNGITYAQVAEVCEKLKNAGERISVRAVQSRTGGSMTTVLKHYRAWQDGQGEARPAQRTISQRLQRALLAELRHAAAGTRQAITAEFRQEISVLQVRLEDSAKRVATLEQSLGESEAVRQTQQELIDRLQRELEDERNWRAAAENPQAEGRKKPAPDKSRGRLRKTTRKKPKEDQEPNLFDF